MKKIILLLFIPSFIVSCRKDVAIPEGKDFVGTVTQVGPFIPLTVGSFWVYDYFILDTGGIETYNGRDTMRIIKDSIINGKTYAVFKGSYEQKCNNCVSLRRDSLDYLVDEKGIVYFSENNFKDTLANFSSNGFVLYYKMTHKDSIISVPAGIFSTYDYERVAYFNSDIPRHCHYFYSNGIGIVKSQWRYYGPPNYSVAKLVNYYISP